MELENVRTVAKRLSVSERQIWKLLAKGEFPKPIRLGRAVRWSRQTIDEWLAQQAEAVERQAVRG